MLVKSDAIVGQVERKRVVKWSAISHEPADQSESPLVS
jgi:hypothetical protein